MLWNLALDPAHGPHTGGCADCRGVVTIDPKTGAITRNVEYYVLGHASRFVLPGAFRVGASSRGGEVEAAAFLNPDGSRVAILYRKSGRRFVDARAGQGALYPLASQGIGRNIAVERASAAARDSSDQERRLRRLRLRGRHVALLRLGLHHVEQRSLDRCPSRRVPPQLYRSAPDPDRILPRLRPPLSSGRVDDAAASAQST